MRRVVVAVTALFVALGGAVVVGYLLLFSALADRAARAAPADTALYVNAYLQPSAGQQINLFGLIGRIKGFGDAATLESKIDEVAGRLLGQIGIDYTADVRPWLGAQIALAVAPGAGGSPPSVLVLAAVKDTASARTALPSLFGSTDISFTQETLRGRELMTSDTMSYAMFDDLLVVANTPERLRAAVEADADVAPSLADSTTFTAAMRTVASDHVASVYVDLPRAARLPDGQQLGGFGTAALALTADADGLHLDGTAPFRAGDASNEARAAFALGTQSSTLAGWMPRTTGAEIVLFGAAQSFEDLEASLAGNSAFAPALDALNQLRAIAALGLGINFNRDLLPLFDGEGAVALQSLDADGFHGQVFLRPSDAAAAQESLDRVRSGLADRGSRVTTRRLAGTTLTSVAVPQIGTVAYALQDGVVILGLDAADVAAGLEAHAASETLASDDRYKEPFELTGAHAGNELWADIPTLVDGLAGIFDPGSELRDILHQIGELAIIATATDDRLEINGLLTVR
ncbi:MAG: DUF3352 domain-containing protein [Chloroflexi bacterium]|nr:DUF3352 domain-containing protein [Chloroflexota bacterium]